MTNAVPEFVEECTVRIRRVLLDQPSGLGQSGGPSGRSSLHRHLHIRIGSCTALWRRGASRNTRMIGTAKERNTVCGVVGRIESETDVMWGQADRRMTVTCVDCPPQRAGLDQ